MRWKTKLKKQGPKIGDKKYSIKFAFLPKTTEDKKTVWLETYLSIREFATWEVYLPECKHPLPVCGWKEKERWSQDSTMWNEWHEKI